jgi:UDP-N-acetylglucosamine acyltransferase
MGEPPRWAGVNRVGLERAGWSPQRIAAAASSLRVLFRGGLLLEDALARLDAYPPGDTSELVHFCREIGRGLLRPKR